MSSGSSPEYLKSDCEQTKKGEKKKIKYNIYFMVFFLLPNIFGKFSKM